jgi:hypothetical protein
MLELDAFVLLGSMVRDGAGVAFLRGKVDLGEKVAEVLTNDAITRLDGLVPHRRTSCPSGSQWLAYQRLSL